MSGMHWMSLGRRQLSRAFAQIAAVAMVAGVAGGAASAQGELPSIGNPTSFNSVVGSGARAWGMGGAFIATADDGTAASWNPAGLAQSPRAMFTLSWIPYEGTTFLNPGYTSSTFPEEDPRLSFDEAQSSLAGETRASGPDYLSFAYPFLTGDWRWVVQGSYQNAVGFDYSGDSGGYLTSTRTNIDEDLDGFTDGFIYQETMVDAVFEGTGAYDVYSASVGAGNGKFFAGLAVNYWDAKYSQNVSQKGSGSIALSSLFFGTTTVRQDASIEYDMTGWNVNVGFLYKPNQSWAFGLVYKSPFELKGSSQDSESASLEVDGERILTLKSSPHWDVTVDWPMTIGAGVAYKPTEYLRLAFDVTQTNWSDGTANYYNGKNLELQENGEPIEDYYNEKFDEPYPTRTKYQTDARQYRLGAEYLFQAGSKVQVPLRGGVFADSQLRETIDGDSVIFYGYALGTGIQVGGLYVDLAYVYSQGSYSGFARKGETEPRSDSSTQVFLTAVYRFSKLGS